MKKWKSLIMIVCTVAIAAYKLPPPSLRVERSLLLKNYPSGSSIEFYNNRLYLIGDDATQLLILSSNYDRVDSLKLFKGEYRISKNKKADLESSSIVPVNDEPNFLMLGSSSTRRRENIILFQPEAPKKLRTISIKRFNKRVSDAGVRDLNYEGLTSVGANLVLSNRGHINNPINQLVVTKSNFWVDQKRAPFNTIDIRLDKTLNSFIGVSGLTYVPAKDLLLFTASTENTANTTDDGEIEDSYIGWITNISSKLKLQEITPDGMINLARNNQLFRKQKIESVCVQEVQNNSLVVHLISDNDNGQSTLFRARFSL